MEYVRTTTLAVLALAVLVPLLTQNRPWHTFVHITPISPPDENVKAQDGGARCIQGDASHVATMEVLFVLDPNFYLCWESVELNQLAMSALVPWLLQLKNVLTQTRDHPEGNLLELPDDNHSALEIHAFEGHTFAELVEDNLKNNATSIMLPSNLVLMHQAAMSNWTLADLGFSTGASSRSSGRAPGASSAYGPVLSLDRLHVTTVDSFWARAIAAHHKGTLTGEAAHDVDNGTDMDVPLLKDLSNAVIVLPRHVPQTHDTSYERTADVDPLAWGVPDLVNMVRSLTRLTGAMTMPGLDEWALLPDKRVRTAIVLSGTPFQRHLHKLYQGHFAAKPNLRAPPIPTAFVEPPAAPEVMLSLCHSDAVIPSNAMLDASMQAIFNGIFALEAEKFKLAEVGIDVTPFTEWHLHEHDGQLPQYVLKREFAEGAIYMTMLQFPSEALLAAQDGPEALYRGEELWRAKPAFPQHSPEGVTQSGSVSTVPFLRNAALQMLKQGCGEGWLLQPKILDMPDLEYRVYLVGGAQATGTAEDTVVVYTPSVLDHGIYMSNITLPHGRFWSDVIEDPDGSGGEAVSAEEHGVSAKLKQERNPWHCPELYQMIVSAALDGAHAMAAFQNSFMSSVSNMFVRVDVVLAVYWSDDGKEMFAQPMINEMDWFNSAAQMIHHWPSNSSQEALATSWGARLAKSFLREAVTAFDKRLQR